MTDYKMILVDDETDETITIVFSSNKKSRYVFYSHRMKKNNNGTHSLIDKKRAVIMPHFSDVKNSKNVAFAEINQDEFYIEKVKLGGKMYKGVSGYKAGEQIDIELRLISQ